MARVDLFGLRQDRLPRRWPKCGDEAFEAAGALHRALESALA
jgi:hypothetical protein